MPLKNILLLYKKSAYTIYFLERKKAFADVKRHLIRNEIERFKKAHEEHYQTLGLIEDVLKKYRVRYEKTSRGENINYNKFDFIIAVGGDGTFLEAARNVQKQIILGVNSSPNFSMGRLCSANPSNFERILKLLLQRKIKVSLVPRLRVWMSGRKESIEVTNDILICHHHPAAMSRYRLEIGGRQEEQRNSGLWISTALGSSGAIQSAGGKVINPGLKKMQYWPRELYVMLGRKYQLTGGLLSGNQKISVVSLMREGMLCVDGAHYHFPFPFGSKLKISLSPHPLRMIRI
ncbi:MAG TPA: hypothetical protein DD723_02230 [Candidatus Omnitrophica bacterium]|nr:MAG: hypothetical protein A2Z81_03440 [Omnitrophica WOR_2 bacterium GWA2_45_18]OGX18863.1 MAG: hypothetical protein A2Y04_03875 [Omnitrophica WOR_2 bacterium GWC2_45_7]HBR14345.1 hypothetical protein [Candidatus Omnitrophota bacterium]